MAATALRALGHAVALVPLSTLGDRDRRRTFAEIGDRGIFASEIEEALRDGRDRRRRALGQGPDRRRGRRARDRRLPGARRSTRRLGRPGPVVGRGAGRAPASARRRCGAARSSRGLRPDLRIEPVRGNVDTRLRKRIGARASTRSCWRPAGSTGSVSADEIGFRIRRRDEMPPESGQGIVVLQVRAGEEPLVAGVDHADSALALHAERAGHAARSPAAAPCRSRPTPSRSATASWRVWIA